MKQRLLSIDVFRGLTVMLMTIVNNPGDWGNVYPPLLHAHWHGATPTDMVFPFFLFIVGVSTVLATPSHDWGLKVLIRGLRIIALGMFLNFFSKITFGDLDGYALLSVRLAVTALFTVILLTDYDRKLQLVGVVAVLVIMFSLAYSGIEQFANVRLPGVLQRIGLVYMLVAALYYRFGLKPLLILGAVLLVGYSLAMQFIPVNGVVGNFEADTNLAAAIDRLFLTNHMWVSTNTWDPEGLFSTIPALGTGILGVLAGTLLTSTAEAKMKFLYLLSGGVVALVIGLLWNQVLPINKALWTSSFVCYAGGWAAIILAICYGIIEVFDLTFWTKPFMIFGLNPMLVFFFSGIIPRIWGFFPQGDTNIQDYFYTHTVVPAFADPRMASFSWAFIYLLAWFAVLYVFYRKRIVVKV